jgi:hypothetical protein
MQRVAGVSPAIDIRWFGQSPRFLEEKMPIEKYKEVYRAMKTGIKAFLILSLLAAAFTSVGAADDMSWKFVAADSKSGERYFYRPDSVMHAAPDVIGFKMMIIHGDASKSWSDSEINCRFKIIRDLRTRTERFNKPPRFDNFPSAWRAFDLKSYDGTPINSPEAELYRALCR